MGHCKRISKAPEVLRAGDSFGEEILLGNEKEMLGPNGAQGVQGFRGYMGLGFRSLNSLKGGVQENFQGSIIGLRDNRCLDYSSNGT